MQCRSATSPSFLLPVSLSDERQAIREAVEAVGAPVGPKEIAEATGLPPASVRNMMPEMFQAGQLDKVARGAYVVPAKPSGDGAPAPPPVGKDSGGADDVSADTSPARRTGADDEITIRVHTGIRVGAALPGGGYQLADASEDETDPWRVARRRMYELLGVWLEDTDEAIYIEGLSMKRPGGGLDDGQLVIFRPCPDFVSGQRHVFQAATVDTDDYRLFCKRVQTFADGSIRLISDNRSAGFTDEDMSRLKDGTYVHMLHGANVKLMLGGRVIWPREQDDEREIRLITQTIERLASSGLLSR